jgi:pantoate--beta-alanine ligase
MTALPIARTVADLRRVVAGLRAEGRQIGFVPTMGALHEGHLSLGEMARAEGAAVVYSIFVNPTQFAPHEDFDRYPRNLVADAGLLAEAGVADLVFAPDREVMYPPGFATSVDVGGPSEGLETDFRPHFFGGVAVVVAKLLNQVGADFAVFGEKDYQQLQVITRLAADLDIPTRIVGAPIMREPDGLAMSSRNAYLDPRQRAIAGKLNLVMKDVVARIARGDTPDHATAFGFGELLAAGFDKIDYLELRDAASLEPVHDLKRPARLLCAVHVGATRLIDNIAV